MKYQFHTMKTQLYVLAGLLIGLLLLAFLYYDQQKKQFEIEISKQLWAISEMKILQINDWKKERFADAYFISHNKEIIKLIKASVQQPNDLAAQINVQEWMKIMFQNNQYAAMAVLSNNNHLLTGTEDASSLIDTKVLQLVEKTNQHRHIGFSDVYQSSYGKNLLYLVIPLFENSDATSSSFATVILIINPYAYFFPMVNNWPYATKTAECILIKKENGKLINLSRLRFRGNHSHEFTLDDKKSIIRNFFEHHNRMLDIRGYDYRGVKVYREITIVPGFDWFLICKEDASEIMSDFNHQAFLKILATFFLLVSCGLGLLNIWSKQRENQLRSSLVAADEIKRLNRTYSVLSSVDQTIVHTRDPRDIIRNTCKIAVDNGGFCLALYGELTPDLKKLKVINRVSAGKGILTSPLGIKSHTHDLGSKTQDVIASGKSQFYNNFPKSEEEVPLLINESIANLHSAAVFPLKKRNTVIGIFYFYSEETDYFNDMEIKLINELSEELSYAMDFIDEEHNLIEAKKAIDQLNEDLENRVVERTTHLESVIRELNSFSYSVSHDLRAPLRSISGYTEIIRSEYSSQLSEDGINLLSKVQRNIMKMGQLIDDLLSFSQISKTTLRKGIIDMTQMAKEVYDYVASDEQKKFISFQLNELPYASGDANYMTQVWQNLLENAIKFTSKCPTPVIVVNGETRKNETIFWIKDNGIGFEPQYAEKIFGTFERLHTDSEFEGTGIGLALAKRIIQRHGGEIWAEGELNQGATFYFSIPN
jgi:signal transduction histidine kinase